MGDRGSPPHLLFHRAEPGEGLIRITVSGEVDMTTGDRFEQTIMGTLGEPGLKQLTLDVGRLRFIDSNGVAALMYARRTADERGIDFSLSNADDNVRGVLRLLGVYEMLTNGQARST